MDISSSTQLALRNLLATLAPDATQRAAPASPASSNVTALVQSSQAAPLPENADSHLLTLLVNTRDPRQAAQLQSSLDATTLQLASQGTPFRLLARTDFPVPEGALLSLALTADGAHIDQIDTIAQLPPGVRIALSQALVRQGNPQYLLQRLLDIINMEGKQAAPAVIRELAMRVAALLPSLAEVTDGDGIRSFLKKSGLFFEAHLAEDARLQRDGTREGNGGTATPSSSGQPASALHQETRDNLNANAAKHATRATEKTDNGQSPNTGKTTVDATVSPRLRETDLKGLLLTLKTLLDSPTTLAGQASRTVPATQRASDASIQTTSREVAPHNTMPGSQTVASTNTPDAPFADASPDTPRPSTSITAGTATDIRSSNPTSPPDTGVVQRNTSHVTGRSTTDTDATGSRRPTPGETANRPSTTGSSLPGHPAGSPSPTIPPNTALGRYGAIQRLEPARTRSDDADTERSVDDTLRAAAIASVPGLDLPLPLRSPHHASNASMADGLASVLLKHTEEALARTTLHQLNATGHLKGESATQQSLSFDLPIVINGQVEIFNTRIDIDHDAHKGGTQDEPAKKEKLWSVSLGFDIEGLGPMFCQLGMLGNNADIQLWAESHETQRLAETHLPTLARSLGNIGVTLGDVRCHHGMPKQVRTQLSQQLVDVRT